jgi:predicted alpha-1,6-mannanase (GH76 family)
MTLTSSDRDSAIDSYNAAFYHKGSDQVGYYCVDKKSTRPNSGNFWTTCEQIEALEDAYQRTNNATHKGMITELVNGLNQVVSERGTLNWAYWNKFNDDVMWGVIALARAYELTGKTNQAFLQQAQEQFNAVWKRGWTDVLGGGLLWKDDPQHLTKNACVNFPAVIAAMFLARNTRNTGFRSQADKLWTWSRRNLYDESSGRVNDSKAPSGKINTQAHTYNQGTFIGAAYMLFLDTHDRRYLDDCAKAAAYSKGHLTKDGILVDEYGGPDGKGFKGIFARWCSKYAKDENSNNGTIKTWLARNANSAWSHRNSANLMWAKWRERTPDGDLSSWDCSSGLAITQNAP